MSDSYPALLAEMATWLAEALIVDLGATRAAEVAVDAVEHVRRQLGGRNLYMPAGSPWLLDHRDQEIRTAARAGETLPALASKHGLSLRRIRQILAQDE
jgi:Mor family transcriptional regulator